MEEFRVVVADLDDWMANSSPSWDAYHAMMACRHIALDKRIITNIFYNGGGESPSTEEGADLQGFTPVRAHLVLLKAYGDFPHTNNGTHLTGGVPDNAAKQIY